VEVEGGGRHSLSPAFSRVNATPLLQHHAQLGHTRTIHHVLVCDFGSPNVDWFSEVWARGHCRISPPRFLAECCKRQLNPGSFVLLYFRLSTFPICIGFVYLYFPVLFSLSVSVKRLAVKTASEMTYTVSSGALNSTPIQSNSEVFQCRTR